jgi:hypothetical protein
MFQWGLEKLRIIVIVIIIINIPHIQWVPESLSLGVKRPGREADHSPPFSTEVKE